MVCRLSPMFETSQTALTVVTFVGAATAIFAATVGTVQNDIKRVIAYSTCSQLGYMFSLAGIPPMFGFWPKLMVFNAAVEEGLYALAVAGILGTVVGAYYYFRIVKVMYFDAPGAPFAENQNKLEGVLIALAALFVSPLGYLLIGPLGELTGRAAGSLF